MDITVKNNKMYAFNVKPNPEIKLINKLFKTIIKLIKKKKH